MMLSTFLKSARQLKSFLVLTLIIGTQSLVSGQCTDLYIAGVLDGPLTGGTPKGVLFCAVNNIPDLSIYGFGSANNGGGTDGEEFTFPAQSVNAGDCFWVASEEPNFTTWFGFAPCFTDGAAGINGDDAIELFCSGAVVDILGEVDCDPNSAGDPDCVSTPSWEYTDGWLAATDMMPSATYNPAEWMFSGINVLDGETTNGTATTPFPMTTQTCPGATAACSVTGLMIVAAACTGDDFDYEICATVANGSGDYNLIDANSNAVIQQSPAATPDGLLCFLVTITGPTTASTLDLNVVDAADGTCLAAAPATLNILECPAVAPMSDIYISELSYNPCTAQGPDGECEYIILTNSGTTMADISNYTISTAFSYTFPAGTTIPAGGTISLGISGNCAELTPFDLSGGWSGSMTNGSGETLDLSDSNMNVIFSITYNPADGANGDCDALCVSQAGNFMACVSSLESGTTCPDLTLLAPPAIIVDSTCPTGDTTPSGGSIMAATAVCPPLSTLQYSDDGGTTWLLVPPTYNQAGPAQTIMTRCLCDSDMLTASPISEVPTVPGTCAAAACEAFISTFPANGN